MQLNNLDMCLYPSIIKNPKYKANQKNGGVIPAVTDVRTLYVPIGCQNCMECRKQKARAWQVRLLEDIKDNRNGKFVTLTFSDESFAKIAEEFELTGYELDNEVATRAVRLFLERWRKKFKKSLRHWLVTELGHNGTKNIHLHGIVWTDEDLRLVEEIWSYGYVWKGRERGYTDKCGRLIYENYVSERTVNYIIKYITKVDAENLYYKSRVLTSPGIGKGYTNRVDAKNNRFRGRETQEAYRTRTGHKINMPIYWRNKIYSEQERELLWTYRLDKEERYILGEKVTIRYGEEEYLAGLRTARDLNRRLGYGSDYKDEDRWEYEQHRRKLMQETRIRKAKAQYTFLALP